MTDSKYQSAIYAAAKSAKPGSTIAVEAVAGSGKTHVIETSIPFRKHHGSAAYFAYNRHIVDAATQRLRDTDLKITTIHSHGMAALYANTNHKLAVDEQKYLNICRAHVNETMVWHTLEYGRPWECIQDLTKLLTFARLTLANTDDPEQFSAAATAAGLTAPFDLCEMVPTLLWQGATLAEDRGSIDFCDMLWLPIRWQLALPQYDSFYVDELQDLSPVQLQLILNSRAHGAIGMLAGDRNQSVMGWAHAGGAVFDDALAETEATSMPLSICYRCPTTHLDLARELVPHIEARPDAPAGTIVHMTSADYVTGKGHGQLPPTRGAMWDGDMVICRRTAPLIAMCLNLLRNQVPARVRGRDLGSDIAGTIRAASPRNTIATFEADLTKYAEQRSRQLTAQGAPPEQHALLADRVASAQAAYEGLHPCETVAELIAKVQGVFADNQAGGVSLSTVHRAKGLEADRVFIRNPKDLTTDTQEEANVKYVALTRARHTLGFIDDEGDDV